MLKGSRSSYNLERSERLKDLSQPTISIGARGLRNLCQLITFSRARSWRDLVNLPPPVKREAEGIFVILLSPGKWEAIGILFNLSSRANERLPNDKSNKIPWAFRFDQGDRLTKIYWAPRFASGKKLTKILQLLASLELIGWPTSLKPFASLEVIG